MAEETVVTTDDLLEEVAKSLYGESGGLQELDNVGLIDDTFTLGELLGPAIEPVGRLRCKIIGLGNPFITVYHKNKPDERKRKRVSVRLEVLEVLETPEDVSDEAAHSFVGVTFSGDITIADSNQNARVLFPAFVKAVIKGNENFHNQLEEMRKQYGDQYALGSEQLLNLMRSVPDLELVVVRVGRDFGNGMKYFFSGFAPVPQF